jgi:hypothetical protein
VRNVYNILAGKCDRKKHSEDLGVDGKIISEWFLGKQDGKLWTECIWLWIENSGGPL